MESLHTLFEVLREGQRLREDVSQPIACRYADKSHLTVLNHFVSEVLADVHVLGALASRAADDTVSSFDARCVVFVDRGIIALLEAHIVQQNAKECRDDLDCHFRSSVILCFSCCE